MRTKSMCFTLLCLGMVCLIASPLQAVVIVNDSWADGDQAKTGALDSNWWTSSSSSGDEITTGSFGLVTGTSGRGVHTIFPTQSLGIGDSIKATYTFVTPATVGSGSSASFRVGLFDTLGRAGLDAHVSASSGSPNDLYGWGLLTGGPGNQALPGYMLDHDVNTGATADLNFREHVQSNISPSGRLMGTTSNGSFAGVGSSGPDAGYIFAPNTTYTGMFQITRINATDVQLDGDFDGNTHSVTDTADSFDVGMLAFHANSNQFGSSNSAGTPLVDDNGIDFTNVTIEFIPVPEPSSIALILGAVTFLPGLARRR